MRRTVRSIPRAHALGYILQPLRGENQLIHSSHARGLAPIFRAATLSEGGHVWTQQLREVHNAEDWKSDEREKQNRDQPDEGPILHGLTFAAQGLAIDLQILDVRFVRKIKNVAKERDGTHER